MDGVEGGPAATRVPRVEAILGPRAIWISALAIGVAFAAGVIARQTPTS